jgi:hypothetical protein
MVEAILADGGPGLFVLTAYAQPQSLDLFNGKFAHGQSDTRILHPFKKRTPNSTVRL